MGADAVAVDTERLRRWRLVLGQPAEEATGISLDAADMGMDRVLEALYDTERQGGLGPSQPNVHAGSATSGPTSRRA